MRKLFLIFTVVMLPVISFAQGDTANTKRMGIALSSFSFTGLPFYNYAYSEAIYMPSIPLTTSMFLQLNQHKFLLGVGVWNFYSFDSKIYGLQSGYQYQFLRKNKKSHLFFETNLQYVAYYRGEHDTQRTYPLPKYPGDTMYTILKYNTLFFFGGIGGEKKISKNGSSIFLMLGTGGILSKWEYLAKRGYYGLRDGTRVIGSPFIKAGFHINIKSIKK